MIAQILAAMLTVLPVQDPGVRQVPGKSVVIECHARYVPLTPYELVGYDECGHMWKLILPKGMRPNPENPEVRESAEPLMGKNDIDEPICTYFNLETGEFRRIPCPEPGEVTGRMEIPLEGEDGGVQ